MFGVPGPKPECKAGEPARSGSGLAVPLGSGAVSPLGPHGVEDGRGGRRPLWLNRAAGSQRLRPVCVAGLAHGWTGQSRRCPFASERSSLVLICCVGRNRRKPWGRGGTFQGLPLAQSVRQELGRRQGEALASPGCTSGDSEHLCLSFPFSTVGEGWLEPRPHRKAPAEQTSTCRGLNTAGGFGGKEDLACAVGRGQGRGGSQGRCG